MEEHTLLKCIPWSRSKNASWKQILIINLNHYQMDLSMCIPLSPWQNRREILNSTNGTEFQDWLYPIRTASKLLRPANGATIWWVMEPYCYSAMGSTVAKDNFLNMLTNLHLLLTDKNLEVKTHLTVKSVYFCRKCKCVF